MLELILCFAFLLYSNPEPQLLTDLLKNASSPSLGSWFSVLKFKSLDFVGLNKHVNYYCFSVISSSSDTFIGFAGLWLNTAYFTTSVSGAMTALLVTGWLVRAVVLRQMPLAIENLKARRVIDLLCTDSLFDVISGTIYLNVFCHPLELNHLSADMKLLTSEWLLSVLQQWRLVPHFYLLAEAVDSLALLWFLGATCALTHVVIELINNMRPGTVYHRGYITRAGIAAGVILYGQILIAGFSTNREANYDLHGGYVTPAAAHIYWNGMAVDVAQNLLMYIFMNLFWGDWVSMIGNVVGWTCFALFFKV